MEADGLRAARRAGDAFVGFAEGEPRFAPTFKVRRQAGLEYNPQRTPSYTDRILWKSMCAAPPHTPRARPQRRLDGRPADGAPLRRAGALHCRRVAARGAGRRARAASRKPCSPPSPRAPPPTTSPS